MTDVCLVFGNAYTHGMCVISLSVHARYKRIAGASNVSKKKISCNERRRLTLAIESMKDGRMPSRNDKASHSAIDLTPASKVCVLCVCVSHSVCAHCMLTASKVCVFYVCVYRILCVRIVC